MKFLIGSLFLILTILLFLITAYCVYLGITENWTWYLVGLPLGISSVICGLITSVGLSIPFSE